MFMYIYIYLIHKFYILVLCHTDMLLTFPKAAWTSLPRCKTRSPTWFSFMKISLSLSLSLSHSAIRRPPSISVDGVRSHSTLSVAYLSSSLSLSLSLSLSSLALPAVGLPSSDTVCPRPLKTTAAQLQS
jgi:hypothetical protein